MSRIVHVEVGRFDYEMVGDFKFFDTRQRPSVLVRLTDDHGVQGWGQSVPVPTWTYETAETVETTLRRHLAPAIVGAEPSDLADIHRRMELTIAPSFSIGQPLCKAAIDLACYDLWGKQIGQSVSQILGGAKASEMKLSWTIQASTLSLAEEQLARGQALGYASFNVKLGYPQSPSYDLELIRRVRALAPIGSHWADVNTHYDLDTALEMAPKLADAGFTAIESPLPPNQIRGYQKLKRQGALCILMDEGIISPVEAAEFIALEMMDGSAMKVARCGGLWNAHRIVGMLQESGLQVYASGLTDPDLSMAASVHLFASADVTKPLALNGPEYLAERGSTDPDWRAKGDMITVPTRPGLGIMLNTRAQAALSVAV